MPRRPYKRTTSADRMLAVLEELRERPAMNGGFQRLAEQQTSQCDELKAQSTELAALKSLFDRWDRLFKWMLGIAGTIATGVIGRLVYDAISHLSVIVK